MRSVIELITNSKLTDIKCLKVSAPIREIREIREGDLVVRRVDALALPAFLFSAASTLPLQEAILSNCTSHHNLFFESIRCQLDIVHTLSANKYLHMSIRQ